MDANISCCGIDCSACDQFQVTCRGCNVQKGRIFWTDEISDGVCPIYACCRGKKQQDHCGLCKMVPCKIWTDMKDPSWSEEEHQESILSRLKLLERI
jgi:hypothetical protein